MKENVCSVNHFFAAVVLSVTVASGWEFGEYGMWCYTYNRNTDTEFWPTLQMERDRGSWGRECRTSHSITTCSLGIDPRCVVCCLCVCVSRLSDPPGPLVWSVYWMVKSSCYESWLEVYLQLLWLFDFSWDHKKLVTFWYLKDISTNTKSLFWCLCDSWISRLTDLPWLRDPITAVTNRVKICCGLEQTCDTRNKGKFLRPQKRLFSFFKLPPDQWKDEWSLSECILFISLYNYD